MLMFGSLYINTFFFDICQEEIFNPVEIDEKSEIVFDTTSPV